MAGWRVNYGFWPRVAIIGAAFGFVLSSLISPWLDVPPLSQRQNITYCACVGAAFVAVGISTAELWVFPVPFFIITLLVPLFWILVLLLCAVVGVRAFCCILSRRDQLRRMNNVAWLLMLMCVGYPAFQLLFIHASYTIYELPVLLLLFVFKIVTKRLYAHLASHKWDFVPSEIAFTVDFFDALYLTTFIPNLTLASLIAIVTIDLVQAGADIRELHYRLQIILQRLDEAEIIPDNEDNPTLLAAVRLLAVQKENISGIRVRSGIFHQLPSVDRVLLEKLEGPSCQCRVQNTVTVLPIPPVVKQPQVATVNSHKSLPVVVNLAQVLSTTRAFCKKLLNCSLRRRF